MKVYLRTLCGCEQVVDLDARKPLPHVVDVEVGGHTRSFCRSEKTDRYPMHVFLEEDAALPAPTTLTTEMIRVLLTHCPVPKAVSRVTSDDPQTQADMRPRVGITALDARPTSRWSPGG